MAYTKTKQQLIDEIAELKKEVSVLADSNRLYQESEREMQETHIFLKNILNTSVDGIIVTDAQGDVTFVNNAIEDMFGYSKDDILGKNTLLLRPDGESYEAKGAEFIARLFEDGFVKEIERKWKRRDGSTIDIELNAALFKDSEGSIIGAVGSLRDITKRKWAEARLGEHQLKLRSLASKLVSTEEKERKAFAEYLHDSIGHTLFILKIKLEMARDSLTSGNAEGCHLQETIETIHQLIVDTRTLTFDLSPPILYQLGFEAALEWLFEQMQSRYGLQITFVKNEILCPLEPEIRPVLFRSVRELMMNVVKHAQTHHVAVSLERNGENICINVEDDGVGFIVADSGMFNKGFGLFSIKERMEYMGGDFAVASKPGSGTKASLIAPLKKSK